MKKTPKTEYKYNEPLDLSNGTITITKGSGTKDIAITENMVSGYDPTKLGKQTITVTYGGKTTSYEVNVKDYVTGISITPNAITGTYNDELEALINENDIIYTVTYAKAGATSPRALTESMVAGYNKTSLTAQNLTVTYADKDANSYTNGKTFTTTLGIKLDNNVAKITITPPTKSRIQPRRQNRFNRWKNHSNIYRWNNKRRTNNISSNNRKRWWGIKYEPNNLRIRKRQ